MGAQGRERGDGSMGTGALGRERGDGSMVTGAWGRERRDGTMGTVPWERYHGNCTVGTAEIFLLSVSKKVLHRMIEMIYFHGSIGKGGEGQHFFLYMFQKIFYIL